MAAGHGVFAIALPSPALFFFYPLGTFAVDKPKDCFQLIVFVSEGC